MAFEEIKTENTTEEKAPEQPKSLGEVAKEQAFQELESAQKYHDQFKEKIESRNRELADLKLKLEEKHTTLKEQGQDAHSGLTATEAKVIQQRINEIQRDVGDSNKLLKEYEDTLEKKRSAAKQYSN